MPRPAATALTLLDAVTAHMALLDADGRILAVNQAWTAFADAHGGDHPQALGVGADYLAVCRRAEARGSRGARRAREGLEAVLRGERASFSLDYPCHAPDRLRWFTLRATPVGSGQGGVVSHEDITARRQAERALRRARAVLEARVAERTQALRLAAMAFDSAVEAIVVTDAERRILTVNQAFTRITGYPAAEVLGRNPRLYASGRHGEAFYDALWQTLRQAGHWQGEIWNRRRDGDVFPAWESISALRDEAGAVSHYVAVFSDISQVKHAEERLAFLAHHDPLTGLANRLLFAARLDQAIAHARRRRARLALLFIDMDNFKLINDSLGHATGDLYLQAIGRRLAAQVRAEDTVARLGGDEFAVLVEQLGEAADAGRLAAKLGQVMAEGVLLGTAAGGHEVSASASIGIALYPDDAAAGDELMKAADAAMYQAKAEGRHAVRYFQAEMGQRARRRLALENSLRRAVARQELRLHYQPVLDLHRGRPVGFEALLRWDSAEHGWLMPAQFVPLAEESRLIQPLGAWVIEQALRDLARWQAAGARGLRLAVNVSWRQFNDEHFVDRLLALLAEPAWRSCAAALDLEVTETALQGGARAVRDLHRLREAGLHVLIDDFGTGHSSLSQLMDLPVSGLKIDRQFLREATTDRASAAIIRAVLALAQGLDLQVVAEGVETEAQAAWLRAEGCRYGQGWLWGAPITADQVATLLAGLGTAPG